MSKFHSFLAPLMESFIVFRKASGVWNDGYESNLLYFDRHCMQSFASATELTQEMVDSWCGQREGESNDSCRTRIYPAFNFIDYLKKRGRTDVLLPGIPKRNKNKYIPHAFSHEELYRFFQACDSLPDAKNYIVVRSRRITVPVFFRLLYSSGIRTCEARWLRVEDVDLEQGILNIRRSKGLSQHYVVLHDSMLDLMKIYGTEIRKLYPGRIYFFPGRGKDSCLSRVWVHWNFREIWNKCNESRTVPYDLRHNYAIENINGWIGNGLDFSKLVYLSKSMGHCELDSTKYYFSLVPALSDILDDLTGKGFDEIVPEVGHEESK